MFLRFLLMESDFDPESLMPQQDAAEEAAWGEYRAGAAAGVPLSEVNLRLSSKHRT